MSPLKRFDEWWRDSLVLNPFWTILGTTVAMAVAAGLLTMFLGADAVYIAAMSAGGTGAATSIANWRREVRALRPVPKP